MSNVGFIVMEEPTVIPQAATEKIDNTPIEIAQAAKDKVYVVWYDNGEEYDDNYQDIDRIFSSYDDAAKYLDDCGYIKQVENGYGGEYIEWHVPYDEEYPYNNSCYFIREFDLY
jgi:hypothetical protein